MKPLNSNDVMLQTFTRFIAFIILAFSLYLFFRRAQQSRRWLYWRINDGKFLFANVSLLSKK